METKNVQIDSSTPSGKRLLREVEKHPGVAKTQFPLSKELAGQKT